MLENDPTLIAWHLLSLLLSFMCVGRQAEDGQRADVFSGPSVRLSVGIPGFSFSHMSTFGLEDELNSKCFGQIQRSVPNSQNTFIQFLQSHQYIRQYYIPLVINIRFGDHQLGPYGSVTLRVSSVTPVFTICSLQFKRPLWVRLIHSQSYRVHLDCRTVLMVPRPNFENQWTTHITSLDLCCASCAS